MVNLSVGIQLNFVLFICGYLRVGVANCENAEVTANNEHKQLGDKCTPGQSYVMGCNTCICGESGVMDSHEICTKMACDKNTEDKHMGDKCTPGISFRMGCNSCICGDSGVIDSHEICTKMACLLHNKTKGVYSKTSKMASCPANEKFQLSPCVKCQCPETGIEDLTKCERTQQMPCKSRRSDSIPNEAPALTTYGAQCDAGDLIQFECNYCRCSAESYVRSDMCTNFKCSLEKPQKIGDPCHIGSLFYLQCNLCRCGSTGIVNLQLCTEEDCGLFQNATVPTKLNVSTTEHVTKMMEQNDDSYTESTTPQRYHTIIPSTVMASTVEVTKTPSTIPPSTIPPSTKPPAEKESTILSTDTPLTIFPSTSESTTSSLSLQPTVENTTLIMLQNEHCVPNTVYEDECNYCKCSSEGFKDRSLCTNHICMKTNEVHKMKDGSSMLVPKFIQAEPNSNNAMEGVYPGMPCIPNVIYKWDCNYCTCPHERYIIEVNCTTVDCIIETDLRKSIDSVDRKIVQPNVENSTISVTVTTTKKIKRYRILDNGAFDFSNFRKSWNRKKSRRNKKCHK